MKTDEKIKKQIVDQLYWDNRIDASDIKVSVDGSDVSLEGKVPDYTSTTYAVLDAYGVEGVSKVSNNLEIKIPSSIAVPTDDEIKRRVENLFVWSSSIDSKDIDVGVSNGHVALKGSVDTYYKKVHAENLISNVTGVVDITNKLTIVPTKSYFDKEIAEDIEKSIDRRYDVAHEDVDVKVSNGIVTLLGKVPSWYAYSSIKQSAENTLGVVDVVDKLKIEY
jgi:osmotically-inducible protein OsmY